MTITTELGTGVMAVHMELIMSLRTKMAVERSQPVDGGTMLSHSYIRVVVFTNNQKQHAAQNPTDGS